MTMPNASRRDFLKASALAGLGASLAGGCATGSTRENAGDVTLPSGIVLKSDIGATRPRPAGQQPRSARHS